MTAGLHKNYFSGLDTIRAILTILACVYHIEMVKAGVGMNSLFPAFEQSYFGDLIITGFFVLSGFLISYILLREKQSNNNINTLNFYKRRALRIWPLYYIYIIIAFTLFWGRDFFSIDLPQFQYNKDSITGNLLLHLFGMPNIAFLFTIIPFLCHTWTIGVEEQFYAVWPLILKHSKNILQFCFLLIVFLLTVKTIYHYYKTTFIIDPANRYWPDMVEKYLCYFRIECMAAAGITAYYFVNKKYTAIIYTKPFQLFCYGGVIAVHLGGYYFQYVSHTLYSFFLSFILVNIAGNQSIISFQNKILAYIGKISYGMYISHMAVIIAVTKFTIHYSSKHNVTLNNIVIYTFSLVITFIIGTLSYKFIETPFLNLKKRFT